MIRELSVVVVITCRNEKILKALHESTNPENKLAPESIKIHQIIKKKKLIFSSSISTPRSPIKLIDSFRRTVDDFIFSLHLAYKSIREANKYAKNEILCNNREGHRRSSGKRSRN